MKQIIIARGIMHSMSGYASLFGRGNITTHTAGSSEEILNMHGVHRADLIITEVSLPLMGASQLCSSIRSNNELKNVSIIVVNDGSGQSPAECGIHANAVIQKQAGTAQLFSLISELLVIPQRKDLRSLLRVSVKGNEGEKTFFAMSCNLSMSGMLLECDHDISGNEKFFCTFNIAHTEIRVECVIVRVDNPPAGRRRYGVKFINCDTKSLVILDQFVKSQVRHLNVHRSG